MAVLVLGGTSQMVGHQVRRRVPEGVAVCKVLKLQQHVALPLLQRAHELCDEVVVLCAPRALLAQAWIGGVVKQALIVGADVQADGQTPAWVDACNARLSIWLLRRENKRLPCCAMRAMLEALTRCKITQ